MSGSGDDDRECSAFGPDESKCDTILAVRRTIAVLSLVSCIYIIFVFFALKRYQSPPQRLIVYLSIAVFFNVIQYVWGDHRIAYNASQGGSLEGFCKFQGFYHITTAWTNFFLLCIITFNIVWITVLSKRLGMKAEIAYAFVVLIPSFILGVIPFSVDAYGPAGIWCWIRSKDDDGDQFVPGIVFQFLLYYGPWTILSIVMAIVLLIVPCLVKYRLWKARNDEGEMAKVQKDLWNKDIKPLMPFPWIYIATFICPVINRLRLAADYDVGDDSDANFALWFLHAVTLPLPGLLFAIVITCNKETIIGFKELIKKCFKKGYSPDAGGKEMNENPHKRAQVN